MPFTDDIEVGAISKDGRSGTTLHVITRATMERDHGELALIEIQ